MNAPQSLDLKSYHTFETPFERAVVHGDNCCRGRGEVVWCITSLSYVNQTIMMVRTSDDLSLRPHVGGSWSPCAVASADINLVGMIGRSIG